MATALTNAYTGICIGGPKDGQTLEGLHDHYDCIDIEPLPPLSGAPDYMASDGMVSFTKRGTYFYHGAAVQVFGLQIGIWAWNDMHDERMIADAIMAKLTTKTKRR